jgi:hypothetical protein
MIAACELSRAQLKEQLKSLKQDRRWVSEQVTTNTNKQNIWES